MNFKSDSTQNKTSSDILALYIGNNKSVFQNEKKQKIDSLILNQTVVHQLSKPLFKVNHTIYKNLNDKKLVLSETIDNILFGYEEPIEIRWNLEIEKKDILSYECYKATARFRGRKYIAWYTNAIPVSDGPYKFSGLPGLILELYDDKENFHYNLLQIINKPGQILYNDKINMVERRKLLDAKINLLKKISEKEIKVNPIELN